MMFFRSLRATPPGKRTTDQGSSVCAYGKAAFADDYVRLPHRVSAMSPVPAWLDGFDGVDFPLHVFCLVGRREQVDVGALRRASDGADDVGRRFPFACWITESSGPMREAWQWADVRWQVMRPLVESAHRHVTAADFESNLRKSTIQGDVRPVGLASCGHLMRAAATAGGYRLRDKEDLADLVHALVTAVRAGEPIVRLPLGNEAPDRVAATWIEIAAAASAGRGRLSFLLPADAVDACVGHRWLTLMSRPPGPRDIRLLQPASFDLSAGWTPDAIAGRRAPLRASPSGRDVAVAPLVEILSADVGANQLIAHVAATSRRG